MKPKSLDAAYERKALEEGFKFNPVFPENKATWGQPAPVANDYPHIHDLVVQDIVSRKVLGISKYGVALQPYNGRDMLKDAYEEVLDLAVYLKGKLIEMEGK